MKRKIVWLLLMALLLTFAGCSTIEAETTTTALTEDAESVFHNPDMGWVFYENFMISPSESSAYLDCANFGYDFPGVDYVMLKYTWADIETEKDVYNFQKFDYIYDYWTLKGKTVMLGMSTDSLLWYGVNGKGIPQYVLDALPEGSVQHRIYDNGNNSLWPYDVCNANEPYYQERLKLFLEAMAAHMKETNRPVDYIDLRGYGLWGEWHQGYQYENLTQKRTALDKVLQIWSEAFPEQHLALSYSFDPDEPRENYTNQENYGEYLYWSAFDLALKYENITLRRDGCGGVVQNNERIFCEQVFSVLKRGPFTSEAANGYTGYDSAKYIVDDGLTLHPNYFTIVGWTNQQARDFIEEQPELFNYGLNNMGYRFTATEITYPTAAQRNRKMTISGTWKNTAVGRAMRNYELWAVLTDEAGNETEFSLGETDCSQWIKGQEYTCSVTGEVPKSVKKGEYTLNIALYDPKTEKYIELAINEKNGADPWYTVGKITIV